MFEISIILVCSLNFQTISYSSCFQWLCVPFILTSPSSANFTLTAVTKLHQEPWLGKLKLEDAGRWIDDILLLVKQQH